MGKHKQGRICRDPRTKPVDWDTVKMLCAMQCTKVEIYAFLGFNPGTLDKACQEVWGVKFKEKYAEWKQAGNVSLRRFQWKLAEKNAALAIFLGKQYLNQSDERALKHGGDLGVQVVHYGDKAPEKWGESASDKEESDENSEL